MASTTEPQVVLLRKRSWVAWTSVLFAAAVVNLGYVPLVLLAALLCRATLDDIFAVQVVDGSLRLLRCRGLRRYDCVATLGLDAALRVQVAGDTLRIVGSSGEHSQRLASHCEAVTVLNRVAAVLEAHGFPAKTHVMSGQFAAREDTRAIVATWMRPLSSLLVFLGLGAVAAPAYGLLAIFPATELLQRLWRACVSRLSQRQCA